MKEPLLAVIDDALRRGDGQLRDTVMLELSPAAWDTCQPDDPEKIVVVGRGPVWDGLPGDHPLLPFVRDALAAVHKLREGT